MCRHDLEGFGMGPIIFSIMSLGNPTLMSFFKRAGYPPGFAIECTSFGGCMPCCRPSQLPWRYDLSLYADCVHWGWRMRFSSKAKPCYQVSVSTAWGRGGAVPVLRTRLSSSAEDCRWRLHFRSRPVLVFDSESSFIKSP